MAPGVGVRGLGVWLLVETLLWILRVAVLVQDNIVQHKHVLSGRNIARLMGKKFDWSLRVKRRIMKYVMVSTVWYSSYNSFAAELCKFACAMTSKASIAGACCEWRLQAFGPWFLFEVSSDAHHYVSFSWLHVMKMCTFIVEWYQKLLLFDLRYRIAWLTLCEAFT